MIKLNPKVGTKVNVFEPLSKLFAANYAAESLSEIEEILNITKRNGMQIIEIIEIEKNKSYCIKSCLGK